MKVLVLGASGLLGSNLISILSEQEINFVGSIRETSNTKNFKPSIFNKLSIIENIYDPNVLIDFIQANNPTVVINCLSLPSLNFKSSNLKTFLDIYSYIPFLLDSICRKKNIKHIHISSDGVFSGKNGPYNESHLPDPQDNYGLAKFYGENSTHFGLVIRTSIIGHSLNHNAGLLDWFLSQEVSCKGYKDYIFSGMTARELSKIITNYLLKDNDDLKGIINIGGPSISKYDLLDNIAKVYNKDIKIEKEYGNKVNRSLDSSKFMKTSGYKQQNWKSMLSDTFKNQANHSKDQ